MQVKLKDNNVTYKEFVEYVNNRTKSKYVDKLEDKLKQFKKIADNGKFACYEIDKWVGCGIKEKMVKKSI